MLCISKAKIELEGSVAVTASSKPSYAEVGGSVSRFFVAKFLSMSLETSVSFLCV